MEFRDQALYHQMHPLKLATDWGTALVAAYLLWQHLLLAALLVGFIPPVLASLLVIRYADLERLKESPAGHYVARYMTRSMELVRSMGAAILWVAAWFHWPMLLALGLAAIVLAWARGKIWPGDAAK